MDVQLYVKARTGAFGLFHGQFAVPCVFFFVDGGSPVPRWWEPPPAPTRVVLDPAASPPPMCDGSGAGFGF